MLSNQSDGVLGGNDDAMYDSDMGVKVTNPAITNTVPRELDSSDLERREAWLLQHSGMIMLVHIQIQSKMMKRSLLGKMKVRMMVVVRMTVRMMMLRGCYIWYVLKLAHYVYCTMNVRLVHTYAYTHFRLCNR